MTWLALLGAVAVIAAIVLVPGGILAAILGMRGLWAWALAGPFGVTIIVLAALVAPLAGMAWSVMPVLITFAVVAAGLVIAQLLTRGFDRSSVAIGPRGRRWVPATALVIAGVLLGAQLAQTIQAPGNISQTFDNIFHLNAIRYALDTANASPLHLGSMTSESGGVWFYPSAWHAIASLVVQVTGVDIAIATNGLAFFSAAVLWPAGAILLARTAFGASSALMLTAGVFAAALPSMPLLLLDYGVLYPFELGLSLAPAALAAVLVLLRIGAESSARVTWVWVIAVLGTLPGMTIAHPGAFMAWLVIASVAVLLAYIEFLRSKPSRNSLTVASSLFVGFVIAAVIAWRVLRPPADARGWQSTLTLGQGLGEAATLSYWSGAIPVVVLVALAVGLIVSARRRTTVHLWAIIAFVATSGLYVAAVALPWPTLRDLLTASWYNNAPRLAAIVPILIVPLAALGAAKLWVLISAKLNPEVDKSEPRGTGVVAFAAVAVLLGLAVTSQMGAVQQAIQKAQYVYALTPDSPLVSVDEMSLLRRLADDVPGDAVIAGSPWTGTGVAYAISGRKVLMPHTLMDIDDEMALINNELDEAARRDAVCEAILSKGVQFVLDFGDREVHGAEHPFPGFDDLATSDAVEVVDFEGDAVLYRVVACGVGQ